MDPVSIFLPIIVAAIFFWLLTEGIKHWKDEQKSTQAGEKRICTSCGMKLSEGEKHCASCGQLIEGESNTITRENDDSVGERYGNGKHMWQVTVNNNEHVVTLEAGWKDTLRLDGDVIESGMVAFTKDYKFQIDGEPALLTTRASTQHGGIHKLFVSGRQVR